MNSENTFWILVVSLSLTNASLIYSTYYGKPISEQQYNRYVTEKNDRYCAIVFKECDRTEGRRVDGTCNNLKYPSRGASLTPFDRLRPAAFTNGTEFRTAVSGKPLPNARLLRTTLVPNKEVLSEKYTSLLDHIVNHLTAEITTQHDTEYVARITNCCKPEGAADSRCMPIQVPESDPYLKSTGITCLNLTRASTYQSLGCVPYNETLERIAFATPHLDLSIVYGVSDDTLNSKGRLFVGGLLKLDKATGRDFPPSNSSLIATKCPLNELPEEKLCFDTPNAYFNGRMFQVMNGIWFWRLHNYIAKELAIVNPKWNDEKLFTVARSINIAFNQQILTYELMPVVLGRKFGLKHGAFSDLTINSGFMDIYDDRIEPRTYIEFVAGLRWFHQVLKDKVNLYDHGGSYDASFYDSDIAVRSGILPINKTIEKLTQESFRGAFGCPDSFVGPDIGGRAMGRLQKVADAMSSDLMKSRDQGLAPYIKYREICGFPKARSFEDLLDVIPAQKITLLKKLYGDVNDIDYQVGLWVENIMEDAVVGPTLGCIMAKQFRRYRVQDRFWFERPNVPGGLNKRQLSEIRKITLARVMCEIGDKVDQIQAHALYAISDCNPLRYCSDEKAIKKIDFGAWKLF